MRRLSVLTLIFAIAFAVFFLLLIFFRTPFPLYPLMNIQDMLDLLTPLVLIPIYWLLFKNCGEGECSWGEEIAFMVLAAVWVMGHGMHLAANSIDNLAEKLAKTGELNILGTNIYSLTYFVDEHLSHYIWHLGILGMTALILFHELRRPAGVKTVWWVTVLGGLLFGFSYFSVFLEGQTVVLGLPFALLVIALAVIWGLRKMANQPVLAFFFVACVIAAALLIGWGIYWKGFLQFSDVGLI